MLRLQDFPYSCEPGVEHHNIWCMQPMSGDAIMAVVEQHRPQSHGYESLMFINPVELQSVRTVRSWLCGCLWLLGRVQDCVLRVTCSVRDASRLGCHTVVRTSNLQSILRGWRVLADGG